VARTQEEKKERNLFIYPYLFYIFDSGAVDNGGSAFAHIFQNLLSKFLSKCICAVEAFHPIENIGSVKG
jgi:hypothetical protein